MKLGEREVLQREHPRLLLRLSLVRSMLSFLLLSRLRIHSPNIWLPGPGALTRALLTLPRDTFDKLIVLEEQPKYLEYLKVIELFSPRAHIRSTSRLMTVESDTFFT